MPRLISAILAIFFIAAVPTLACPSSAIAKRWFGVGNPAEGEPATINAWPVVKDGESAYDLEYDNLQLLRYCWTDKDSYKTLNDLLEAAIGKWHIATSQSNLRIVPASGGDPPICGQGGVAIDSLYITDITNSDEEGNSAGYTTPGYNAIARDRNIAGRHVLKFRRSGDDNTDAVILAHEIGHAIGMDHEFARPDAANHVFFYPENLIDYEEVKAKIDASDSGYDRDGMQVEDRSSKIRLFGLRLSSSFRPIREHWPVGVVEAI